MNITPHVNHTPIATVVNPQTDSLRRENSQREVIAQPAAASKSAAEKGVASDRERAKTPAQNNADIDFASIREKAEAESSTIAEQSPQEEQSEQQSNQQSQEKTEQSSIEEFEQEQEIISLKQRDREVRSHELAHAAVGGPHTGAPSYTFTVGPDGKKYATSGEVSVDLSVIEGDPQATITKLKKVYSAALAPANPSIQDTRVAAQASQLILQAQSELLAQELDNPELANNNNISPVNGTFSSSEDGVNDSQAQSASFDQFINSTLAAQEEAPRRSDDVTARAGRIESFYSSISQAYNKEPTSHFQLTA